MKELNEDHPSIKERDKPKRYSKHQVSKPRLDTSDPEVQLRKCLGPDCGEAFMSSWKGNRICPKCSLKVKSMGDAEKLIEHGLSALRGTQGKS